MRVAVSVFVAVDCTIAAVAVVSGTKNIGAVDPVVVAVLASTAVGSLLVITLLLRPLLVPLLLWPLLVSLMLRPLLVRR